MNILNYASFIVNVIILIDRRNFKSNNVRLLRNIKYIMLHNNLFRVYVIERIEIENNAVPSEDKRTNLEVEKRSVRV